MAWQFIRSNGARCCCALALLGGCVARAGDDPTSSVAVAAQACKMAESSPPWLPAGQSPHWRSGRAQHGGWGAWSHFPRPPHPPQATGGAGGAGGAPNTQPVCGDSIRQVRELCDDGNIRAGDGCSPTCTTEPGWVCHGAGKWSCHPPICGDGIRDSYYAKDGTTWLDEGCDDGNHRSGDGCSAACAIEPGWSCTNNGSTCHVPVCGDGVTDFTVGQSGDDPGSETCDDGNAISNDGCDATCHIESLWLCPESGKPCHPLRCGDGIRDLYDGPDGSEIYEGCDDGNATPGDGCDASCQTEPGWTCYPEALGCHVPSCGDGNVDAYGIVDASGEVRSLIEDCDDGNAQSGDGCSATCSYEPYWVCGNGGQACRRVICGDGLYDSFPTASGVWSHEGCDDGNTIAGDGCSPSCEIEGPAP